MTRPGSVVKRFISEFEKTRKISVDHYRRGTAVCLSPEAAVFRIVQEALNNGQAFRFQGGGGPGDTA